MAKAPAPTYLPDALYTVAFAKSIRHPEQERMRFLPGRDYEVRGRILEGVKSAVLSAVKLEEPSA